MKELTRNETLVLGVLRQSRHQLSAYDILGELRADGLKAPLQVYRALEKLIEKHLVHKLESLNAFVSCSHEACHRNDVTAFTICTNCGEVLEFVAEPVATTLRRQASKKGFQALQTSVEIKGLCSSCRD